MDLKNVTIKVDSIEKVDLSFGTKYVIKSDGKQFEFFEKKSDGTNTKAFEQYSEFAPPIGTMIEVGIEEKPYTYTSKKTGKEGSGINNIIKFFKGVVSNTSTSSTSDLSTSYTQETFDNKFPKQSDNSDEIATLHELLGDHEKRLKQLEFRLDAENLINGK